MRTLADWKVGKIENEWQAEVCENEMVNMHNFATEVLVTLYGSYNFRGKTMSDLAADIRKAECSPLAALIEQRYERCDKALKEWAERAEAA